MSTLKILSLNCRGLNNTLKRRMLFKQFLEYNICSLQETYVNQKNVSLWKQDWRGEFVYVDGTSNSNGLIILINKNFSYNNLKELKVNGRCLGITFTHNDKEFAIFNMYAPAVKEERIAFLTDLPDLSQFYLPHYHVIFNGDYNMLTSNVENISGLHHSPVEIASFNTFIDNYNLTDTWRLKHPDKKEYSWIRFINQQDQPVKYTARRLDYLFCNLILKPYVSYSEMRHFSSTDHKAVISCFKLDSYQRGKGTWAFNDSLLDDDTFMHLMSEFIQEHYTYLKDEEEYSKNEIWDLLKVGIRDEVMAFSRNKRLNLTMENVLCDKITKLNSLLTDDPCNGYIIKQLCNVTKEKEIHDLSISRGALKRSRVKFISDDERCTSYFLGLERSRQEKQVIKSINNENGDTVDNPNMILPVIANFYNNLMNDIGGSEQNKDKSSILNSFLGDTPHPVLNTYDMTNLEMPITIAELEEALKYLNADSAPGCDGLTPLFYKYFWDYIRLPFFESIIESTENKLLTLSQRRSLITLLPKSEDKDQLKNVSNYRPISLTTTDYKLYSKVLASRLQHIIHKLISVNQVGYIKGRNINDHIRFIDDVINYSKTEDIPGLLVSLDYRKAFDTVCKSSIIASLSKYNFGPIFTGYVATILNGSEASIKNAGWISEWFPTSKGVRQGCSLSPLLFILVVELLAIKIRGNNAIKSVLVGTEHGQHDTKFSQYADDVSLYLKDVESLKVTLNEIDNFTNFSGLTLNRTKSIAMWLGRDRGNAPGEDTLKWLNENDNIKILGVYFNASTESSLIEKNWETKIQDIKKVMANWAKRHCSIWGKTIVAKTFLLSKINYILQSLSLPDNIQKVIDDLMFKFLWKKEANKKVVEKIKRSTLCLDVDQGGIGMISVEIQQKVMLIKWLHRLLSKPDSTHFRLVNSFFEPVGGLKYFILCTVNQKQCTGLNKVKSIYWRKAMAAWLDIDKSSFFNGKPAQLPIFNNILVLYKNKPIFVKHWIDKDFKFVHQMFKNKVLKTFEEIRSEVGSYPSLIFDYLVVKNAIIKSNGLEEGEIPEQSQQHDNIADLSNKTIRNIISKKLPNLNCIEVWKRKLNIDISNNFGLAVKATKETRLRVLHFKILHNIYPSNTLLYKMGIKTSSHCDECHELEFLDHMLFSCAKLHSFWQHINDKIVTIIGQNIVIETNQALFGLTKDDTDVCSTKINEANHLILLAKLCITKHRFKKPSNLQFIFEYEFLLRKTHFSSLINEDREGPDTRQQS